MHGGADRGLRLDGGRVDRMRLGKALTTHLDVKLAWHALIKGERRVQLAVHQSMQIHRDFAEERILAHEVGVLAFKVEELGKIVRLQFEHFVPDRGQCALDRFGLELPLAHLDHDERVAGLFQTRSGEHAHGDTPGYRSLRLWCLFRLFDCRFCWDHHLSLGLLGRHSRNRDSRGLRDFRGGSHHRDWGSNGLGSGGRGGRDRRGCGCGLGGNLAGHLLLRVLFGLLQHLVLAVLIGHEVLLGLGFGCGLCLPRLF
mmetsp:Transcript_9309/g.10524  ORF Transcript_9309/g.10524 Transcript_9309/m.10524 type:complete len:256 (+) Transcript_9309:639-1406(+)